VKTTDHEAVCAPTPPTLVVLQYPTGEYSNVEPDSSSLTIHRKFTAVILHLTRGHIQSSGARFRALSFRILNRNVALWNCGALPNSPQLTTKFCLASFDSAGGWAIFFHLPHSLTQFGSIRAGLLAGSNPALAFLHTYFFPAFLCGPAVLHWSFSSILIQILCVVDAHCARSVLQANLPTGEWVVGFCKVASKSFLAASPLFVRSCTDDYLSNV
jgi:hypothetical protein